MKIVFRWDCPYCGTANERDVREGRCSGCRAPMPKSVGPTKTGDHIDARYLLDWSGYGTEAVASESTDTVEPEGVENALCLGGNIEPKFVWWRPLDYLREIVAASGYRK